MRKARADGVSRIGLLALVAGLIFGGATCADLPSGPVSTARPAPPTAASPPLSAPAVTPARVPSQPLTGLEPMPVPVIPLPTEPFVAGELNEPDLAPPYGIDDPIDPYVVRPPPLDFVPGRYRLTARLDASSRSSAAWSLGTSLLAAWASSCRRASFSAVAPVASPSTPRRARARR